MLPIVESRWDEYMLGVLSIDESSLDSVFMSSRMDRTRVLRT